MAAAVAVAVVDSREGFNNPADFIFRRDPKTGRLVLAISADQVMNRSWFRIPDFIAHKLNDQEPLLAD